MVFLVTYFAKQSSRTANRSSFEYHHRRWRSVKDNKMFGSKQIEKPKHSQPQLLERMQFPGEKKWEGDGYFPPLQTSPSPSPSPSFQFQVCCGTALSFLFTLSSWVVHTAPCPLPEGVNGCKCVGNRWTGFCKDTLCRN